MGRLVASAKRIADFRIVDHGSLWGFTPLTNDAKHFIKIAVKAKSWQWIGGRSSVDGTLMVDLQPARSLLEILKSECFIIE